MIEDAYFAFQTVYIAKLFHAYDKQDNLDMNWLVNEDGWWSMVHNALQSVTNSVWITGDDAVIKYYFSDDTMMEYYRLCREYCRIFGVSLKDNPFMKQAGAYVSQMLADISGYYDWFLHTRINHKWASGIVIMHGETFDSQGYMELLEALLEIFSFYEAELSALKKSIANKENETKHKEAA